MICKIRGNYNFYLIILILILVSMMMVGFLQRYEPDKDVWVRRICVVQDN